MHEGGKARETWVSLQFRLLVSLLTTLIFIVSILHLAPRPKIGIRPRKRKADPSEILKKENKKMFVYALSLQLRFNVNLKNPIRSS